MKEIRVLGSYRLNPGDLDWGGFRALGDFHAHPHCTEEIEDGLAATAEVLLTDGMTFDREHFRRYPKLEYLGLLSTGHDTVDLDAARHAGVAVTNVPEYSTSSVAQMTIALMLNLAHRICDYDALVRRDGWRPDCEFEYRTGPLLELEGKKLAILGFGSIGRCVARRAHALGMQVLGVAERKKSIAGVPVEWLPWDRVLAAADVISLHLPLTGETRGMINRSTISRMKPGVIVINTARGGLVDDHALAAALRSGHVRAAGFDVLGEREPPYRDNPLLSAPNCIITPHIAWATKASRSRCMNEALENLRAYLNGTGRNRLV